jgi:hypothetical protein
MWLSPVNEMTELVSGMPAPQFGEESSFRAGSMFKQFLCFNVIDVRRKTSSRTPREYKYPRLMTGRWARCKNDAKRKELDVMSGLRRGNARNLTKFE